MSTEPKYSLAEVAAALGLADQAQAAHSVVNAPAPPPPPAAPPGPSGNDLVAYMRAQIAGARAGFPSAAEQREAAAAVMLAALGVKPDPKPSEAPHAASGQIVTDAPVGVPPPAPPPPPPAPMAHVVTDRPLDILKWDHDMMKKFYRARGGNERDFSDPVNAKIWEEVAQMTKLAARDIELVSPRGKRR